MSNRSWHILRSDVIVLEVPVAPGGGFPPSAYADILRVPRPFTLTRDAPGEGTDIEFTIHQPPSRIYYLHADTAAELAAARREGVPINLLARLYHLPGQPDNLLPCWVEE